MTQNRAGHTITSSVSISEEMKEIISQYHLSPTEVFRIGLGVTLHDLGVREYMTPLNHERSKTYKKMFEHEKYIILANQIIALAETLKPIIEEEQSLNTQENLKKRR